MTGVEVVAWRWAVVVCHVCGADCVLTPKPGSTIQCLDGCFEPIESHHIPVDSINDHRVYPMTELAGGTVQWWTCLGCREAPVLTPLGLCEDCDPKGETAQREDWLQAVMEQGPIGPSADA